VHDDAGNLKISCLPGVAGTTSTLLGLQAVLGGLRMIVNYYVKINWAGQENICQIIH
jgi:hypothetical protein